MTGNCLYFKGCWTKFAIDNMIEEINWMVYEYFSHGILDFKVYNCNCSAKGVGHMRTKLMRI